MRTSDIKLHKKHEIHALEITLAIAVATLGNALRKTSLWKDWSDLSLMQGINYKVVREKELGGGIVDLYIEVYSITRRNHPIVGFRVRPENGDLGWSVISGYLYEIGNTYGSFSFICESFTDNLRIYCNKNWSFPQGFPNE